MMSYIEAPSLMSQIAFSKYKETPNLFIGRNNGHALAGTTKNETLEKLEEWS
jgi:hypothetical protein